MKKGIVYLLLSVVLATSICGCGSTSTSNSSNTQTSVSAENEKKSDADFIVNLGKGLEARWTLTDSEEYNSEALETMSLAEYQKADTLFVNAELDAIGDLDEYEFEDQDLKKLAETYMMGLELQKEGIQYQGTTEYTKQQQTWDLGYNYRAVCMTDLYNEYGLTVDEKFKNNLDDFVAESLTAKKSIAVQEYVDELPSKVEYVKDEEKSDDWSTYYKAVIENTTEYEIDSLEIEIDFLDASGVVIYQTSDSLKNIKAGGKVQSSIYYDSSEGDFKSMELRFTAYND